MLMTAYEEYTLYLIGVSAYILSHLSLYELKIEQSSIKGISLHFVFFTLYTVIVAVFVLFIRYMRGEVEL